MPKQSDPILIMQTKLYRPAVTKDLVVRKRLCSQMDEGRNLPLTLVAAPAGYGKSTLASHWVEQQASPAAWLSLEDSDSDLRVFLSYLVAAIQSVYPKSCKKISLLLQSRHLPPVAELAQELNCELNHIGKPLVIVLDDYHAITLPAIHEILGFQLKHPVPQLNLVVVSRRNPSLPLAWLRAQHRICEIRINDLVFSLAETERFLKKATPNNLNQETTQLLHEALEGWPVGLRLALVAMGEEVDQKRLLEGISGESSLVQEYLMTEVLAGISPVRRKCLLRISVLDRFCAPLCEALCEGACGKHSCMYDERKIMGSREAWAPLCVSLDARNHWFRFHHVFQMVLQHGMHEQLQPEEVLGIHQRAMAWLETNGLIEEAMHHARKIGEEEVAQLVIRQRHEAMNAERWIQLRLWLAGLPPGQIEQHPELLLLQAWCLRGSPEMFDPLDLAESQIKALPPGSETTMLEGELLTIRALQHYTTGDSAKTIRTARKALEKLDPSQLSERGFAHLILLFGQQMNGSIQAGRDQILQTLRDRSIHQTTCHGRLLASLCFTYWMEANPSQMLDIATECSKLGEEQHLGESLEHGHYFQALGHYANNQLDTAALHLEKVVNDSSAITTLLNHVHSIYALAMVRHAQGRDTEAATLSKSAVSLSFRTHNPSLIVQSRAFEAELALRQGRLAEAIEWEKEFSASATPLAMWRFYVAHFTQIRILLAQEESGTPLPSRAAVRLSTKLRNLAEKAHNRHFLITALILNALALDKSGQPEKAIPTLGKALQLAQPGGGIRSFVDEGPHVAALLNQLHLEGESLHFAGSILAVFKQEMQEQPLSQTMANQKLLEPLSKRENEVFRLMARNLTNKEIAEKLFISPGTIKRHTNSIYSKLAVHTRREAITKARGLGLLPDREES